jgi:hypothetical protein
MDVSTNVQPRRGKEGWDEVRDVQPLSDILNHRNACARRTAPQSPSSARKSPSEHYAPFAHERLIVRIAHATRRLKFELKVKARFLAVTGFIKAAAAEIAVTTKTKKQKAARRVRLFGLLFWRSKKVKAAGLSRQCHSKTCLHRRHPRLFWRKNNFFTIEQPSTLANFIHCTHQTKYHNYLI